MFFIWVVCDNGAGFLFVVCLGLDAAALVPFLFGAYSLVSVMKGWVRVSDSGGWCPIINWNLPGDNCNNKCGGTKMRSFRSGSGSQRGNICSLSRTPQSLARNLGTTSPFPWGSLLSTVVTKPSYTVTANFCSYVFKSCHYSTKGFVMIPSVPGPGWSVDHMTCQKKY